MNPKDNILANEVWHTFLMALADYPVGNPPQSWQMSNETYSWLTKLAVWEHRHEPPYSVYKLPPATIYGFPIEIQNDIEPGHVELTGKPHHWHFILAHYGETLVW